ncbi:hypothetical protein STEG23_037130, partial [Scotinomys teguina]
MASTTTCTRFTDEYQLFEELGKYGGNTLLTDIQMSGLVVPSCYPSFQKSEARRSLQIRGQSDQD